MVRRMIWIAGALLGGCSGAEVSHDFDPSQDFAKFKTWTWAPEKAQTVHEVSRVSTLNHERIRHAIEMELTAKKFQPADPEAADLCVKYHAAVGRRIEADGSDNDEWYTGDLRAYEEGTLVIDVIRNSDHRLIWRGAARRELDFDLTPQQREEQIRQVVHEILADFPPKK